MSFIQPAFVKMLEKVNVSPESKLIRLIAAIDIGGVAG